MSSRLALLLVTVCGCDLVLGIDHHDHEPADAGSQDDSPSDAHILHWRTPQLVFEAHTDDDPTLTEDMLELYFNRSDDIWWTTRPDVHSEWAPPVRNDQLSSTALDTSPKISRNGLTIFFASERTGAGTLGKEDVWTATRPARDVAWGNFTLLTQLNSSSNDSAASPSADLLELVMHSKRSDGTHYNLYRSVRSSIMEAWPPPAEIEELNMPPESSNPMLTNDRLTIYFDSNRDDATVQSQLYVAHRPTKTSKFDTATPLDEVNGTLDDRDPWISADEKTLYFSSDRGGILGIYMTVLE